MIRYPYYWKASTVTSIGVTGLLVTKPILMNNEHEFHDVTIRSI